MSALDHHYRYPAPSVRSGDKLAWQISRGAEADAEPFLLGRLTQPRANRRLVADGGKAGRLARTLI